MKLLTSFLLAVSLFAQTQGVDYIKQIKNKPAYDARFYSSIQAAVTATCVTGGTLLLPAAVTTFSAQIPPSCSNITIQGWGPSSILRLATNAWPAAAVPGPFWCANSFTNQLAAICVSDNLSNVQMRDFVLDMNGANQTNGTNGSGIYFPNCKDCGTQNVQVWNMKATGAAIESGGASTRGAFHIHDTIHGFGTAPCAGGILVTEGLIADSYADGTCDSNFVANGSSAPSTAYVTISNNTSVNGTAAASSAPFITEGSPHALFIGNTATGPANSGCFAAVTPSSGLAITSVEFIGNTCNSNANGAPTFGIATSATSVLTIGYLGSSGNRLFNTSSNCVELDGNNNSPALLSASFSGDELKSCGNNGFFVNQGSSNIKIANESIMNVANNGIGVSATGTVGVLIGGNTIKNSGNVDINDASGLANVQPNITDSGFNGITSQSPIVTAGVVLVNGLNSNIPTVVGAANPGQIFLDVTGPTGAFQAGGFASPTLGKRLTIVNFTGQTFSLNNEDAGSISTNRITTGTGAAITPVLSAVLVYAATRLRWVVESWR